MESGSLLRSFTRNFLILPISLSPRSSPASSPRGYLAASTPTRLKRTSARIASQIARARASVLTPQSYREGRTAFCTRHALDSDGFFGRQMMFIPTGGKADASRSIFQPKNKYLSDTGRCSSGTKAGVLAILSPFQRTTSTTIRSLGCADRDATSGPMSTPTNMLSGCGGNGR
jgi:hypothetical protein